LQPGLVLVVGENGAGKTNLLESLHVGTQGFSPRTRADAQLVRFGEPAGRIALTGRRGDRALELELSVAVGEGKRRVVAGRRAAPLRSLDPRVHA
jgi:DNA replication and repair protein RecF